MAVLKDYSVMTKDGKKFVVKFGNFISGPWDSTEKAQAAADELNDEKWGSKKPYADVSPNPIGLTKKEKIVREVDWFFVQLSEPPGSFRYPESENFLVRTIDMALDKVLYIPWFVLTVRGVIPTMISEIINSLRKR